MKISYFGFSAPLEFVEWSSAGMRKTLSLLLPPLLSSGSSTAAPKQPLKHPVDFLCIEFLGFDVFGTPFSALLPPLAFAVCESDKGRAAVCAGERPL
jgi:hypothetical protein